MRKLILLSLGLALFSREVRADMTAATSDAGATAASLDGEWRSAQDLKDAGKTKKWFDPSLFPVGAARPIQVPGSLTEVWATTSWGSDTSKNIAWYLKTFPLRVTPRANMRYYLRFGAVMQTSDVWLNGSYLGAHEGGEDPFEFDVTQLLQPGKPNTVAVRIVLWTAPPIPLGGINQHVSIVAQPDVRILDAFARPEAKAGQIRLEVTLENNTTSPAQVEVNGYNLTSNQDAWGAAEGVMNNFREFKPGHLAVLQAGWAPLRWCLLVNPMNAYADEPIHVKAALANEDALPNGDYPATIDITGSSGVVWKQTVVAHVQQNGPLAYTLFDEDVRVPDLKAGAYTLEASLDGKSNATSNKLAFTVTNRASLPSISGPITVVGLGRNVRDLLTRQGAELHDYAPNEEIARETILVGPDFKGKASDWRALYARAARGAHLIFLSSPIFHDGNARNKWLALASRGNQSDEPDWLYHKAIVGKVNQPFLAGLQTKLMTPEYYGRLLAQTSYFYGMTNPTPRDTVAVSIYNSLGGANYHAGVMLATYPFHAGHFTINAFNIVDSMGSPATDRLLLNLVVNAQADAAPLAPLPAGYDAEMNQLGIMGMN